MPTVAPPWEILNETLLCSSLEYLCASSWTSGKEAVAPLIVITLVAEAIAGTALPIRVTAASEAAIRRIRCMGGASDLGFGAVEHGPTGPY